MSGPSILKRGFERAVRAIDHRYGWDRLPVPLGLLALVGIRDTMRDTNLYDNHDVTPSRRRRRTTRVTSWPGRSTARTTI